MPGVTTREREKSVLECVESVIHDGIASAESPAEAAAALVELGLLHIRMGEPIGHALQEIFDGMRMRTGSQNLATVALVVGCLLNPSPDPLAAEHYQATHES